MFIFTLFVQSVRSYAFAVNIIYFFKNYHYIKNFTQTL